jgi:serine/threonine protein kinase
VSETPRATHWASASAEFDRLADLPPEERAAELALLGGSAPELARLVEELLDADSASGPTLLDRPLIWEGDAEDSRDSAPASWPASSSPAVEDDPPRAGVFRLTGVLGKGGMATVHAAERDDGSVAQRVAVKVLRRGLETEDLLARFTRERSILARLEHPAIARLIDAGALPDGRPYLVMERVDGEPVDDYAARRGLSIAARVDLLRRICEAVAFAHRNLVVHRDLKPSNVLVDAEGRPKLLDFGIAQLLGPGDGLATVGEFRLMTPAYAAPEQRTGAPTTTSTDVWGLGALALRLLTGSTPRERSEEAGRLGALGDLGVVLERAMAEDPERRYATAGAFADDLARAIDGRPVSARADSRTYRLRRFVGRHRVAVAFTVAAVAALVTSAWIALAQAKAARAQRAVAERSNARNEALVDFLLGDLQRQLEPTHRNEVVLDLTEHVLASLDAVPVGERDPTWRAQRGRVLLLSGSLRRGQGDTERAEADLREAIARFDSVPVASRRLTSLAEAHTQLALVLEYKGDLAAAVALAREAVDRWHALLSRAEPSRGVPDDEVTVRAGLGDAHNQLGRLLLTSGSTAESLEQHLAAIAVVDVLPAARKTERGVAITLYDSHLFAGRGFEFSGRLDRAAEEYAVAIQQAQAHSDAHPDDIQGLNQLSVATNDRGRALRKVGRLAEAREEFERGLTIARRVVERDPESLVYRWDLSASFAFLGRVAEMRGELPEALAAYREDVAMNADLTRREPENGAFRATWATALTNEGRVLGRLGRWAAAGERHERALQLRETLRRATPDDVVTRSDAAESHLERGRVAEARGDRATAELEWRRARGLLEGVLSESDYGPHRLRLARTLLELGEFDTARPLVERLLAEGANEPELLELWRPVAAATAGSRTPR